MVHRGDQKCLGIVIRESTVVLRIWNGEKNCILTRKNREVLMQIKKQRQVKS